MHRVFCQILGASPSAEHKIGFGGEKVLTLSANWPAESAKPAFFSGNPTPHANCPVGGKGGGGPKKNRTSLHFHPPCWHWTATVGEVDLSAGQIPPGALGHPPPMAGRPREGLEKPSLASTCAPRPSWPPASAIGHEGPGRRTPVVPVIEGRIAAKHA